MQAAGLIYGPSFHYIDHLAPLCNLLQIPLLVTEEEMEDQLVSFYPNVQVIHKQYIPMPDFLVSHFDVIFACTPRIMFDEIFFFAQKLHHKRVHTIWCPHGNSDKGHLTFFMEGLSKEQIALVYGNKMIDFLKQKNVFDQLKKHVITGNFRKNYYLSHKPFYDQLVHNKFLKKLLPSEKTVLYAPTWKDKESSSSFEQATSFLIKNLPKNWNLLIKPHPNLLTENEEKNRELVEKYQMHDRICFIVDFPPIYPLLDAADLYIGDLSSIGYDFLSFNKPMFFLNQMKRDAKKDPGLFLYQCGIEITPDFYEKIYEIIQKELSQDQVLFSDSRKKIDEYTFTPHITKENLQKTIESCYDFFPEPDLNFF